MRLTIVVLAMLALVGSAMAWDESSVLTYSFKKTVSEQDAFTNMEGTTTGAGLYEPYVGDKGSTQGKLVNTLVDVTPTFSNYGTTGDTHQMLVQEGAVTINKAALSSEDTNPELSVDITKSQDYVFSGQFTGMSATFADQAQFGTNSEQGLVTLSGCGNAHAWESTTATGKITTSSAKLSEGAIGVDSWTSLDADGWKNLATMEGGLAAYSEFFGDDIVSNGGSITTSVDGSTTHSWNNGGGWTFS